VSGIQQSIQAMSNKAEEQRYLADQITENCAAKAALQERVHVIETALTESCQEVVVTQGTKVQLQQQIKALENEATNLRDQIKDSTATLERLTSMKPQERSEDYANLQLKLEHKESQLRGLQDKSIAQAKEQAMSIRHAFEKHEEDKEHIRLQAKFECDAMDARHRIEVNDLRHKLTSTDEQLAKHVEMAEERSEELEQAIADKETAQKLAIVRLGQLEKLAADLTHEVLTCVPFDASPALTIYLGVSRLHVQRFVVEA